VAVASTTTDRSGAYALELANGLFVVCARSATPDDYRAQDSDCIGNCVQIEVRDDAVEANYHTNVEAGWDICEY
jgi:hypothetical protein